MASTTARLVLSTAILASAGAQAERSTSIPNRIVSRRVVDLRGAPVPAADVWLVPDRDRDLVIAKCVADGVGRFQLRAVRDDDGLVVLASAEGKCVGEQLPEHCWNAVTIVLCDAATLRGRPATRRRRASR